MPVVSVHARRGGVVYVGVGTQVVNGNLTIPSTARIGLDANVYSGAGLYTVFTYTSALYGAVTADNFIPPAGFYVKSVTLIPVSSTPGAILVELAANV